MNVRNIRHTFTGIEYKKKLIAVAGLIIICLLSYKLFWPSRNKASENNTKVVEVQEVVRGTIKQTTDFIGIIKSDKQTFLTTKTKGILNLYAKPGDSLKKGDLIAQICNEDIERNYKIRQEAVSIAKLQFERANSLQKAGVLNRSTVDEKKSLFLEAQRYLSEAKMALEDIKIKAPFDGIVGLFKFREGTQVGVGEVIVPFYNPKSLIVEFEVPVAVAREINNGCQVVINSQEYSLTYLQKMLDEKTHMCPAYVDIQCSDCIIGTSIKVTLIVKEKKSVITIPSETIFLRKGRPFVYIIKEGQAELTPVELGIKEKTLTEVTAGLVEGDKLVMFGSHRLYPGAPVMINIQAQIPLTSNKTK